MNKNETAQAVLDALGGRSNVLTNSVCMTRLRVTLANPASVDYELLGDVQSVLGTAVRGKNGLEVVFGPRVIDDIYHAFIELTGIAASADDLFPMSRQNSNMRVQIRTPKDTYRSQSTPSEEESPLGASEMSILEDMFGKQDKLDARLLVVNGPNINMLGIPASCEFVDFPTLLELCKQSAANVGFTRCDCFQSNHEGDLIDKIQDALETYKAVVINPSAYGSSSALRDAIRAVGVPVIEVYLEEANTNDVVGTACRTTIANSGAEGYRLAIQAAWDAVELSA